MTNVQADLGPLRISPVTGLARSPGRIIWDISARVIGMKSKKPNQMVKPKLVSFATVEASWTLVTLLVKLIRMLLKWKYHTAKFWHFGRYGAKAKQFCQKSCVPVTRGGVFIWENSHPGYRDLGSRDSPASHISGEARSRKPSQPG